MDDWFSVFICAAAFGLIGHLVGHYGADNGTLRDCAVKGESKMFGGGTIECAVKKESK